MIKKIRYHVLALVVLASCATETTVREAQPTTTARATRSGTNPDPVRGAIDSSGKTTQSSEADSIIGDADDESSPPINDSTAFSCTPKSFGPRDTLTFQMEIPHGGYLTVLTPADTYFYFVYPQLGVPTRKYSVVPSDAFKSMSTLKVPGDIRLPPQVYGRDTIPEAVFSRPGAYVIAMGENLESDHSTPPFICTVTFTT